MTVILKNSRFQTAADTRHDTLEEAVHMASYMVQWNDADPDEVVDEAGITVLDHAGLRSQLKELIVKREARKP